MMREKTRKSLIILVLLVTVALLLAILFCLQKTQIRQNTEQTSIILLNQLEDLITSNQERDALLELSLMEDYTMRARAVSYILDLSPEKCEDTEELRKIAELIKVDEIHLFDSSGVIYAGTHPQYYGYSFDSGEQMGFFRPMLSDKTLSMCQGVTPNTAEGKPMMYAICWNEDGTRMLQIGIEPTRLTDELKTLSISETMQILPTYNGVTMLMADNASGKIIGATDAAVVGMTLDKIGIDRSSGTADGVLLSGRVNGEPSYYALRDCGEHIAAVVQDLDVVNRNIPLILGLVTLYLFIAITVSVFIIRRVYAYADKETKNANTDFMTGFLNRRAYESHMRFYSSSPLSEDFVYISMDINGLKYVNDTYGHDAGDKYIKAMAECAKACFGDRGELFRIGGDEFVALLFADEPQLERMLNKFTQMIAKARENGVQNLSASCAYVRVAEFPDKPLTEIAKIADQRMYDAKREFYKDSSVDRRHNESR